MSDGRSNLSNDTYCYSYIVNPSIGTRTTWYKASNKCRLLGMELWASLRAAETTFLRTILSGGYFARVLALVGECIFGTLLERHRGERWGKPFSTTLLELLEAIGHKR